MGVVALVEDDCLRLGVEVVKVVVERSFRLTASYESYVVYLG